MHSELLPEFETLRLLLRNKSQQIGVPAGCKRIIGQIQQMVQQSQVAVLQRAGTVTKYNQKRPRRKGMVKTVSVTITRNKSRCALTVLPKSEVPECLGLCAVHYKFLRQGVFARPAHSPFSFPSSFSQLHLFARLHSPVARAGKKTCSKNAVKGMQEGWIRGLEKSNICSIAFARPSMTSKSSMTFR